jgi:hypothetical protein
MSPEGAARTAATLAALQDMEDEEEDVPPRPETGHEIQSERVILRLCVFDILVEKVL